MRSWLYLLFITYFSLALVNFLKPSISFIASNEFDQQENIAIFNNQLTSLPSNTQNIFTPPVLGVNTQEDTKKIYVDLTHQRLYAFEGNHLVYDFLISSGKWGRTPTGTFQIWSKFRYTKMSGGSKALGTYYYLPNVPYVMFFANDEIAASRGFSIHGTYWHENFGHPMSHGCINMKTPEAMLLYWWANPLTTTNQSLRASAENPGTEITIYGQAPLN